MYFIRTSNAAHPPSIANTLEVNYFIFKNKNTVYEFRYFVSSKKNIHVRSPRRHIQYVFIFFSQTNCKRSCCRGNEAHTKRKKMFKTYHFCIKYYGRFVGLRHDSLYTHSHRIIMKYGTKYKKKI